MRTASFQLLAAVVPACLLGSLLLTGCSTPGDRTRGRLDPYETTATETRSDLVQPVALMEYSDQAAMNLAQLVPDMPHVRAAVAQGQRVVVLVGDINNKTGNVSSTEFEMMRSRLRNKLLQSQMMREKVLFAESRTRMTSINEREGVGAPVQQPQWDPRYTFFLNGDFYRVARGDMNQYYFEFQLVHAATNEIMAVPHFDIKQYKQP